VVFDGTSSKACTLDENTANLATLTLSTGYNAAFSNPTNKVITTSGNVGINSTSLSFTFAFGSGTHSIGGNLSLATNKTVTFSGTLNITGTFTNSAATRSWSGNISCTDFTLSGSSTVATSGTLTITGDFTAGSSNSYAWGTLKLNGTSKTFSAYASNITSLGIVEVNGSYTLPNTTDFGLPANTITIKSGGTLTNNNAQGLVSVFVGFDCQTGGTYAGTGGLLAASNDSSTVTVTANGTWSNTGTNELSNNTILTSGNSSQTLAGTWSFIQAGNSGTSETSTTATINGTAWVFSGQVVISNDLTETYNVVNNSTSLEFQNTFTMLNGGTFNYTKSSGTLKFTGAAKTITLLSTAAVGSYENLEFSGLSGTKTLAGGTAITCGNVSISTASAITAMNFGSNTVITCNGNWDTSGVSTSASLTATSFTLNLNGTSKTINGWGIDTHKLKTVTVNGSYTLPARAGFGGLRVENFTVANGGTFTNETSNTSEYLYVYPYTANSSFTVASGGTFNQNGNFQTLASGTGTVAISGTFGGTGTSTFQGVASLSSGNASQTVGSNLVFKQLQGSPTLTLGAVNWTFTGTVSMDQDVGSASTYTITNNATSIAFQKAWTVSNTGGQTLTYTKSSGTISFTTNTATITLANKTYEAFSVTGGAKTFSGTFTTQAFAVTGGSANLSSAVLTASSFTASSPATLTLAGASITTSGNVSVSGVDVNPNSSWTLNCGGSGSFSSAAVKNCNASGGTEIDASGCTDSGSNTNVNFHVVVIVPALFLAFKPSQGRKLRNRPLATGLIYDAAMNEVSGQTVYTQLPIPNLNGTGTSLTRTDSSFGLALNGGTYSTSYDASLDTTGDVSFAALVLFSGSQTSGASPYRRATSTASSTSLWGFETTTTAVKAVARKSGSLLQSTGFNWTAGTWYMLTGVAQTSGTLSLYVNGQLIAANSVGSFSWVSSTGGIVVRNGASNVAFSGQIAGAWAWNRALSLSEVVNFYVDPWRIYHRLRYRF